MKVSLPSWLSGLCVLLVAPLFFVGGPEASSSVLLKNVWNFGHIVFFAILLLLIQSSKPLVGWKVWLWVTMIAIAIGALIEIAQFFVGRNASLNDVLHNVFGVWLGLFWGQKPSPVIWRMRFVSGLLIAPAAWLVIDSGVAHVTMHNQFPLLNSFESRHELQQLHANNGLVKIQQTQQFHTHGISSAQVSLDTHPYSGVSLLGSYGDWNGYAALSMDLFNPDAEPLELVVRIADVQHDRGDNSFNDRFNRRILLRQGWNQVQIDLNDVRTAPHKRVMHMHQISDITIFAVGLPRSRRFYLDNVKLH